MALLPERALAATADALDSMGIAYAVTGSFASAWHGVVRATADVDLKVHADRFRETGELLHAAMESRGFLALDGTSFRYEGRFDIELYPARTELDREAIARRLHVRLFPDDAREYDVVTVEDLVLSKLREFSERYPDHKHIDDVKRLVVANRVSLDAVYLRSRLRRYGFEALWREKVEPG